MTPKLLYRDKHATRVANTIKTARKKVKDELKDSASATLSAGKDLNLARNKQDQLQAELEAVNAQERDAIARADKALDANSRAGVVFNQLSLAIESFEARVEEILNDDSQTSQ